MSRRISGTIFCAISAFLFSSRYICAAIQCSGKTGWYSSQISQRLTGLGFLQFLGILALLVGIAYLIAAEVAEKRSKDKT